MRKSTALKMAYKIFLQCQTSFSWKFLNFFFVLCNLMCCQVTIFCCAKVPISKCILKYKLKILASSFIYTPTTLDLFAKKCQRSHMPKKWLFYTSVHRKIDFSTSIFQTVEYLNYSRSNYLSSLLGMYILEQVVK